MSKSQGHLPNDRSAKMVGIFFLSLLVFNFPLLGLFGKGQPLFGIPILFSYIFIVWLGIITLIFLNVRKKKSK